LYGALEQVRSIAAELPLAVLSPRVERWWIDSHYFHERHYALEDRQKQGLYPFEFRMLREYFPRAPSQLFVPGAGSGRELRALRNLGYTVDALEPVDNLRALAQPLSKTPISAESLQSWATHPTGHYDGIFTGWGLWAHLIHQADRLAVLRAFRKVCPKGPVLLSYFRRTGAYNVLEPPDVVEPLHPEPKTRLQRLTRQTIRQQWLHLPPLERGTGWAGGFYFHTTHPEELREEAEQTGWNLAYAEEDLRKYAHAVLTPRE
jgi:hypothetical protein